MLPGGGAEPGTGIPLLTPNVKPVPEETRDEYEQLFRAHAVKSLGFYSSATFLVLPGSPVDPQRGCPCDSEVSE